MRGKTRARFLYFAAAAVLALALLGMGLGLFLGQRDPGDASDANPVQPTRRTVPASVADIPLLNQNGKPTDLAALHGRVVILADFMTSCQEECPITTGALMTVRHMLAADHLLGQVTIVEVTVDPWRDSPSRLLAYQAMTGADWTMLTGTATDLQRLWSWFGVWYQRVPEGQPPDINWQNGQPYTFDIDHSDAVFVLNQSGNQRALVTGDANVGGRLSKSLSALLDQQGRSDLRRPAVGSWTPADMVEAVTSVLGQAN